MLVELRLKNFRCFEDHSIPLRPTTIIVGANNAGKSTIVEALRIVSLVVNRYSQLNFFDVPEWLDAPRVYRGVSPSLKGIEFNALSIFHNLSDPPAIITAIFSTGHSIEIYIGPNAAIYAIIKEPDQKPITNKGRALKVELPGVSILPQVAPLSQDEVILDPDYARRVTSSSWASLHFRNQLNLYNEHFDEFKRLAESTWPGLRIRNLEGKGSNPKEKLALFVQDRDFVAEVAWMGHGLQMWLQTMWFLARSRNIPTIILDEPDVYMHADLQRKLIRLIQGRHPQIIVATHSIEIMSEVDAQDVLIVNRRAAQSVFAASIPSVQQVIDSIGGVHNLQLARLWNSRRCLLVEGKDVAFLRAAQNILHPKSQEPFDTIPNIQLGGWSGWNYAIGSKLLLKNALGNDIRAYCIFDSDYHTPEELQDRYKQAQNKGIELHIWRKKEIENYFIVPDAIQRIIAREHRKGDSIPSIKDVENSIDNIVDKLRENVFEALSTEFYVQDKAKGIAEAIRKARHKIDSAWTIQESRWAIVSGKAIISELSQWAQENYNVSLSPLKILKVLYRNEMDSEFASALHAIEKGLLFSEMGL